jgi:hypothetical protein
VNDISYNSVLPRYTEPNEETAIACSERDYVPVDSFDEMLKLAEDIDDG